MPLHKKVARPSATTTEVLLSSAYLVRCLPKTEQNSSFMMANVVSIVAGTAQTHGVLYPSTSCREQSLLKWSPTFSTWAASSRMIVGWTRRSAPGSARPPLPSSHFQGSCGISIRSRPAPRFVSLTVSSY